MSLEGNNENRISNDRSQPAEPFREIFDRSLDKCSGAAAASPRAAGSMVDPLF